MLIRTQQVDEGLALLDEAMLAAVEQALSPLVTGLIYCSVLEACQQVYAFSRSREWTAALQRWCEQQPQMVAFTGACRVHRAEVMQLNGAWPDALAEVRRACEHYPRDSGRAPPATAFYQQGEMHRLRGDWTAAQASYQVASCMGFEPQPGLALVRLSQGRVDAACASIRRVLGATVGRLERARLLPAAVQVMLAAGDLQEARRASRELDEIASGFATPVVVAMAAHARGAVELAGGDARDALRSLRWAMEVWQQVDAPYEVARVRAMLGAACHLLGDFDGGALELSAAREVFERLGAAPELERLDALGRSPPASNLHGLTPREMQVLRLVATGRTNKAIAQGLSLSERTIDRSAVMLQYLQARSRREGLDIETRVMDGHALHLPDDSFDMAGSQFGVMLFPDLPKALAEMTRVVKPGGSVLIHAYGDPHRIDFLGFLVGAVQSVRPDFDGPPPEPPPLEFQLAHPDVLHQAMKNAGLRGVTVETVTETTEFADGDALWDWLVSSNPIVDRVLGGLDLKAGELVVIRQALAAMVRERAAGNGMARLSNPVNIGIARK